MKPKPLHDSNICYHYIPAAMKEEYEWDLEPTKRQIVLRETDL